MQPSQFVTYSLKDPRVARIMAAGLDAVDPMRLVTGYLQGSPIKTGQRVYALGIGKAALPMVQALSHHTDLESALVITKHAAGPDLLRLKERIHAITVMEAGHPVPDSRSQAAGREALAFVAALEVEDLLVCLVSGGGSSLMTFPVVPMEDLQALTSSLLTCGARIDEINTLRRHLDRVKGGGLVQATKGRVLSLILSDVVGNPLEAIASGPTAPDPTTREQAQAVLEKYGLLSGTPGQSSWKSSSALSRSVAKKLPLSIHTSLASMRETPKHGEPLFDRVENVIVGDNSVAIGAALKQARAEGFQAESLGSAWQGEAREVGRTLADKLRVANSTIKEPFCHIAGGETTVSVQGSGRGGRNQELALAAVPHMAGLRNALLVSLATDGEDGPTDAAGAVVSGETLRRAMAKHLDHARYLARNDAYPFFENIGDLLKTGPTGTNVNDLAFLFKF